MMIVVTGAKSSGKTSAGQELAKRLSIPFIDLDDVIVNRFNAETVRATTCADVYRAVEVDEFRRIEQDAIREVAGKAECVLATGGSTFLDPESRRLLRPSAVWIYLQAPPAILWSRLSGRKMPAYLEDESDPEAAFKERVLLLDEIMCCRCDYMIDVEGCGIGDIAEKAAGCLQHEFSARAEQPNTFGRIVRLTTFGESHGPMIGAVLDGIHPGMPLTAEDIQRDLDKRKPGQNAVSTQRKEDDRVEIVSGVFEGKTTGTPICLLIKNSDSRSSHYDSIKEMFRPGHADFTFWHKYGIRDHRGGGRSSGRETACRVAGGAVARKILQGRGVAIRAYALRIGDIVAEGRDFDEIEKNSVRCPDAVAAEKMTALIVDARKDGNSVGGIVQLEVTGVPAGLGDPVFSKLDSRLAAAIFSIGAVKGVEIGAGFKSASMTGRENNDQMENGEFLSNNAGGILGGISTGQPLILRAAVKPTPSVAADQKTCDIHGRNRSISTGGRHDPCIVPRIIPVVESMAALTLLDAWEIQRTLVPGWDTE